MDILMIILRIIHFFSGIIWVGGAIFMLFFISPTVKSLGPQGGAFMMKMYATTVLDKLFPVVALLTTVSGLWMFWRITDGFGDGDYLSSTPGIVLSIGVLAGISSFLHGGATLGRSTGKMINLGKEIAASEGPPAPELLSQQQELQAYIQKHSQIGFVLMVVAVLGMASARYF